ncbi:Polysaccharide deacetylase [Micromonospora coriariae]|uniref:Polysaccharide deacetylase n=1 Tax=Micromonospora coriariae TaxID=285665 RepID=A0A1C4VMF6_9ACTN|nr:polysaccharide deacetylase family protein [Micromonospora coriariae]SCE85118.1 Polysaccharide deacetylase [Micromonospora coriariae]
MQARAVLASALAMVLTLAGCAQPDGTLAPIGAPQPVESTVPPTPSPRPTRAKPPKPTLRPLPAKLPAGLRRSTGVRPVALTFDDGPSPAWTPKVLNQLRAARVTATFCVVGREVQRHPELVRRIVREGHQLCNHSWRHDLELARRPVAEIRADLSRTNKAIQAAVPGAKVRTKRVHSAARPGAVVLLHDGGGNRGETLAACPNVIADLKRRFGVTRLR